MRKNKQPARRHQYEVDLPPDVDYRGRNPRLHHRMHVYTPEQALVASLAREGCEFLKDELEPFTDQLVREVPGKGYGMSYREVAKRKGYEVMDRTKTAEWLARYFILRDTQKYHDLSEADRMERIREKHKIGPYADTTEAQRLLKLKLLRDYDINRINAMYHRIMVKLAATISREGIAHYIASEMADQAFGSEEFDGIPRIDLRNRFERELELYTDEELETRYRHYNKLERDRGRIRDRGRVRVRVRNR